VTKVNVVSKYSMAVWPLLPFAFRLKELFFIFRSVTVDSGTVNTKSLRNR
jgi:hypothetical protein